MPQVNPKRPKRPCRNLKATLRMALGWVARQPFPALHVHGSEVALSASVALVGCQLRPLVRGHEVSLDPLALQVQDTKVVLGLCVPTLCRLRVSAPRGWHTHVIPHTGGTQHGISFAIFTTYKRSNILANMGR